MGAFDFYPSTNDFWVLLVVHFDEFMLKNLNVSEGICRTHLHDIK